MTYQSPESNQYAAQQPSAPGSLYGPSPMQVGAPTNTLAIISLVTSVLGIHLAGIVTGHIALRQIARTGEQGRGLALAGLIVGYAAFGLVALVFLVWLIAAAGLLFTASTMPNNY